MPSRRKASGELHCLEESPIAGGPAKPAPMPNLLSGEPDGCRFKTCYSSSQSRGLPISHPRQRKHTHFCFCVFLRMKRTSFLVSMIRMRSPMTPPATDKMIRVSVLSTFSTGEAEKAGRVREKGAPCLHPQATGFPTPKLSKPVAQRKACSHHPNTGAEKYSPASVGCL